ncbi:MAG: T9SS type A sorting domain-containing protein [Flavobacterium sp.]|uniref:T9SS type A sorting domain-containing protein n=1 Tax=Flavobacterium sp. TaxID=239 RepID=UPI003BC0EFF9
MRKSLIFIFMVFISGAQAQELHHQMLSAQGASKELSNGMYVSQTVGQQSVIGNYTKDGKTYGQGYQQSVWSKYISTNTNNNITTVTYPNPFISTINFQFSQTIKEPISVSVFDIRGRLIFNQEKQASGNILTIDLPNLASSNYLVRLSSPNYTYYTQILKQ